MGLAACPRASFAAGGFGAGVEGSFADLLRKCAWNGVGGVSASGVSATLPSASCVGLKIFGRADLCRDSAKQVNLMALAAPSVQKSE